MTDQGEPEIIAMMRRQKERVLSGDKDQQDALARAWLQVEHQLQDSFELLARDVADLRASGQPVGISKLVKLERYQRLLRQVYEQVDRFAGEAERRIASRQGELADYGVSDASGVIGSLVENSRAFTHLNADAVQNMIGIAGDGSPLRDLLAASYPDAIEGLTGALIRGAARGLAPAAIARQMRDGSAMGLQRALVIARTEEMRVYREASRQQYIASSVVRGFRRLATKSTRSCIACLVADGEEYELAEQLRAHVQCRCTIVPIVKSIRPIQWETGVTWLQRQDADVQRAVLGAERFDMWQAGDISLADCVTVKTSSRWGDSAVPTPVRVLKQR